MDDNTSSKFSPTHELTSLPGTIRRMKEKDFFSILSQFVSVGPFIAKGK